MELCTLHNVHTVIHIKYIRYLLVSNVIMLCILTYVLLTLMEIIGTFRT